MVLLGLGQTLVTGLAAGFLRGPEFASVQAWAVTVMSIAMFIGFSSTLPSANSSWCIMARDNVVGVVQLGLSAVSLVLVTAGPLFIPGMIESGTSSGNSSAVSFNTTYANISDPCVALLAVDSSSAGAGLSSAFSGKRRAAASSASSAAASASETADVINKWVMYFSLVTLAVGMAVLIYDSSMMVLVLAWNLAKHTFQILRDAYRGINHDEEDNNDKATLENVKSSAGFQENPMIHKRDESLQALADMDRDADEVVVVEEELDQDVGEQEEEEEEEYDAFDHSDEGLANTLQDQDTNNPPAVLLSAVDAFQEAATKKSRKASVMTSSSGKKSMRRSELHRVADAWMHKQTGTMAGASSTSGAGSGGDRSQPVEGQSAGMAPAARLQRVTKKIQKVKVTREELHHIAAAYKNRTNNPKSVGGSRQAPRPQRQLQLDAQPSRDHATKQGNGTGTQLAVSKHHAEV
jgi:hypothetical protein